MKTIINKIFIGAYILYASSREHSVMPLINSSAFATLAFVAYLFPLVKILKINLGENWILSIIILCGINLIFSCYFNEKRFHKIVEETAQYTDKQLMKYGRLYYLGNFLSIILALIL